MAILPPRPQCSDGIDNDGDGLIDYPADPGCGGPDSVTESPACQDGIDNDGDGKIDFDGGASANHGVALGPPDPGCPWPFAEIENPECDDGIDDDGNGLVDFADPKCSAAWPFWEKPPTPSCGLGAELSMIVPLLMWLHRRRRRLTV